MILALKSDFNNIEILPKEKWPKRLFEIPKPPKNLFIRGDLPDERLNWLCVVGSRKISPYGKEVCESLISGLKGYPFVIVSGLALGTDSLVHKIALENDLLCVAVPGSGLDQNAIYPPRHFSLAQKIIETGGCLLSEYPSQAKAMPWMFPERNRIMAGLSQAVLIIEANQKSGTMITARLATDYNRDVLTVPGSIFSKGSSGPNKLISLGASPITSSGDILKHFGIDPEEENLNTDTLSEIEKDILGLLNLGIAKTDLEKYCKYSIMEINQTISALELGGFI